jgi:polyisoprenoid-binding protein YceI
VTNIQLEQRTPTRRRRPLAIVAILAALLVAGVAIVYFSFFNEDAPAPLALSDQPTPTTASGPATTTAATVAASTPQSSTPQASTPPAPTSQSQLAGTWRVAEGSVAGYRVREKLAELPAKSDAVGRSPAVTGTVKVEGSGTALTASEANFEVDLTKLASDRSQRDNRIRTMGLQTSTFPKATFVSTKPIELPADTASGQAVKASADGDLTIHGVTKRVTIPLDVRVTGAKGELVGSLGFPMSDFNITPPSVAGIVSVDPDATLEFKLILEKA